MGLLEKIESVLLGLAPAGVPHRQMRVEAKAASYSVLVRDSGTLFTTRGASGSIVFTLPALADSLNCHYWFFALEDQNMAVVSAEGNNMIASGDIAASTVAYQTSNEIVGGVFYVVNSGTQWLVFPHLADNGQAITIT